MFVLMTNQATLSDLLNEDVGVFLWCYNCYHSATLDAVALTRRLGGSFPVTQIRRKCRCSVCGSTNLSSRPDWSFPTVGPVIRNRPIPTHQAPRPAAGHQLRLL